MAFDGEAILLYTLSSSSINDVAPSTSTPYSAPEQPHHTTSLQMKAKLLITFIKILIRIHKDGPKREI